MRIGDEGGGMQIFLGVGVGRGLTNAASRSESERKRGEGVWLFERRLFVSKPSLRKELVCILKVVLVATGCVVIHDAHRLRKKENTTYNLSCVIQFPKNIIICHSY